jgi:hypothetical protein
MFLIEHGEGVMRQCNAAHRSKRCTYQKCLYMGFHLFPPLIFADAASLGPLGAARQNIRFLSQRQKRTGVHKICNARRGQSALPFEWTSARPIFWQLLVINVYHWCVIEKRFRRRNRAGAHA